jgi:4-hydroxyphenylpyruvate dioxygenase
LANCNSDRVLPGRGILQLDALFGQLERHGYRGYFSIEMFNKDLWSMPVDRAAKLMYQSLLPLLDSEKPSENDRRGRAE